VICDSELLAETQTSPLKTRVRGSSQEVWGQTAWYRSRSGENATGCVESRYKTVLGRGEFLQTDPIRFAAGDVNIYRYVGNDPINMIDPDGREPISISFILTAAGAGYTSYKAGKWGISFIPLSSAAESIQVWRDTYKRVMEHYGGCPDDIPDPIREQLEKWRQQVIAETGQNIAPFIETTPNTSFTGTVGKPASSVDAPSAPVPNKPATGAPPWYGRGPAPDRIHPD
jgi:RHS repeat-associated protein